MTKMTGHSMSLTVPSGTALEDLKKISMSGAGASAEPIDITDLETTEDNRIYDEPDLGDGGELSITGFMNPEVDPGDFVRKKFEDMELLFPKVDKKWVFDGIVQNYEMGEATSNQRLEVTFDIKISGTISVDDISV